MIKYTTGNIFDSDVQALVNTVNCVGVMGRGIALQFKNRFPANFKAYEQACKNQEVMVGKMFVFINNELLSPQFIINFPTKRHWRGKSRLEDIEAGLDDLIKVIQQYDIKSIAIPPLGAGLGGLDWQTVRQKIEAKLSHLSEVEILIFEPLETISAINIQSAPIPNMTAGRATLIELMQRYLNGLLDPFISLLEVHKLMYFMQESGENLRLKYVKYHYGPYAENLRHVLNKLEGHYIEGYADGGDAPNKPLNLMKGAVDEAREFLVSQPDSQVHFDKVAELVKGFESSYGLELLASVHWAVSRENLHNKDELIHYIHDWNERKKQFSPRQIELAYKHLERQGWITHPIGETQ